MKPPSGSPALDLPFRRITLICLVIANMIGAGVFTTSGYSLEALGSRSVVVAAWVVAGGIAVCGAIGYGQLIRWWPESGGEYVFLSRAIHPFAGFLGGWISLIAGFSGAIAFAANGLASYVLPSSRGASSWQQDGLSIGAILAAALLHGFRVRLGARAQNGVVAVKLCLLLAFLGVAIVKIFFGGGGEAGSAGLQTAISSASAIPDHPAGLWTMIGPFASALVWISLSYSGFNAAVYVAEEAPDRTRTVPSAMIIGTVLVTVLYVGLNAVFVGAVPAALIAGKADVAAIVAREVGGPALETTVRIAIVLALWTSVSSMLMAGPRVLTKLAQDGVLPHWLLPRSEAPLLAICLQTSLAIAFVLATSLAQLLAYLGLTLSLTAAMSVACVLLRPQVPSASLAARTAFW